MDITTTKKLWTIPLRENVTSLSFFSLMGLYKGSPPHFRKTSGSVKVTKMFFFVSGLMAHLLLCCFHFHFSQVVMSSPWTPAAPTPVRWSTQVPSQTTESRRGSARIYVTSKRTAITGPFIALPLLLNIVTVLFTSIPTSTLARRLVVTRIQLLRWV